MSHRTRSIAFAVVLAAGFAARAADDAGPDLSCTWRKTARRNVAHGALMTVRVKATIDLACDGGPVPRRVTASLYASADGVAATGAAIATKRVRPRAGKPARVTFDAPMPLGAAGRYVIARVDDADEVAEADESNNVAVSGPFATGEEYSPLETGDAWRYAGLATVGKDPPVAYAADVDVLGPYVVNDSVVAQAVRSSGEDDDGTPVVDYLQRDERGVVDWGTDDPTDDITPQIVPYRMLLFPFATTYDVVTVSRRGLSSGEDVDGDGRIDLFDAVQRTAFLGFEDVDLPVAKFARCAHVRTRIVMTIRLSGLRRSVRAVGTQHQWLAPGIGRVRGAGEIATLGMKSRTEETLTGAATTSGGVGVVRRATSAETGGVDGGGLAGAFDGSNVLVVTTRDAPAVGPRGLVGIVVSDAFVPVREFQIADVAVQSWSPATAAVAYGAGVFVVAYRGAWEPLRLRAVAADGTSPWSGRILELDAGNDAQAAYAVAFDGTNFVVPCEYAAPSTGDRSVFVARVSPDGSLLSTRVLDDPTSVGSGVAAAWDGSNTLCVWMGPDELRAARITATGDVLDSPAIRLATFPGAEWKPCVAASPTGGWFVAWSTYGGGFAKGCIVAADGSVARPDGTAFESGAGRDDAPTTAFDGAEFVLVAAMQGPEGVHAVRVSPDGEAVAETDGGLSTPFAATALGLSIASPIVVPAGDRAMILWRRSEPLTDGRPRLAGALVFPRREDLRSAKRAAR
jgi:hypothetical protein